MQIVSLSARDYDDIRHLWVAAGLDFRPIGRDTAASFTAQLESGILAALGIRQDEQLIGVVLATHDSRKGWINRLAVHPDYRRQGIGRLLIIACETHFEQQKIQIVAALVERENGSSLALFEDAGYHLHEEVIYLSKRANDQV